MTVAAMWTPVHKSKFHGASSTPSKRRLLDGVAVSVPHRSPRNDLVKNYRVHPTYWLISTQVRLARAAAAAGTPTTLTVFRDMSHTA